MSFYTTGILTHTQRVKSLYKLLLKNAKALTVKLPLYRYHRTIIRHKFEENRHIKDPQKIQEVLNQTEAELKKNTFFFQLFYTHSPGGTAHEREVDPPDWVLDYWHPMEKAQYPDYFARREKRKEEFVKLWVKKYGQSTYKRSFIRNTLEDSRV